MLCIVVNFAALDSELLARVLLSCIRPPQAVTSHTVYDVLLARIPQLTARCVEEYCRISKEHGKGTTLFGKKHTFTSSMFPKVSE